MTDEVFLTILSCFLNKFSQKNTFLHLLIDNKRINHKTIGYYYKIFRNIAFAY